MKEEIKGCPRHGRIGDPNCELCWASLADLCKKNNVYVTGSEEDMRKFHKGEKQCQ